MNRAFLWKSLNDAKMLMLACSAAIFAFAWIRVLIVASMETVRFQKMFDNIPDIIKRLSPVPVEDLINYPGLVGFTFEEPIAYLMMAVFAIARGSDSISGEINRGTMEMMLSQPISRRQYLLGHSAVTIFGVAVIALSAFLGTKVGIEPAQVDMATQSMTWQLPFGFEVPLGDFKNEPKFKPLKELLDANLFIASAINYFSLGVFLTGLTTALSSVDRFRWRTIGLTVSIYVVQTVCELTGLAVSGARWLLNLTFFSTYEPVGHATQIAKDPNYAWLFFDNKSTGVIPDLGPIGCNTVLLGLGALGIGFAVVAFTKRDLPAPL